jgi:hypothetical protein
MASHSSVLDLGERGHSMALAVVAAALLLCWPAFYNGHPLAYADSVSYIDTLDPNKAHWARSIFYTAFLFPLRWGVWLWPAVFAQALIVAHLVYVLLRATCVGIRPEAYLGVVLALATCSSLPWFASTVMPDVFTGVVVLGMYLLGFALDRLGQLERWYIAALTAGAITCDPSHLALAAGLVLVIFAAKPLLGVRSQSRALGAAMVTGPLLFATAAHLGANASAHHSLSLAPASPIVLLERMIEDGTAQAYLRERCPERGYVLCGYLDELPDNTDAFLWDYDSVLVRAGGPALNNEAREIVLGVFRDHPIQQLGSIAANGARQLLVFGVDWLPLRDSAGRPIGQYVRHFSPADHQGHLVSRQSTGRMPVTAVTLWHAFFALVGFAASLFLFLEFVRRGDHAMIALFVVISAALIVNALVTGGFSPVRGHHQSRVVWLVVLYAAIGAHYFYLCSARESEGRRA